MSKELQVFNIEEWTKEKSVARDYNNAYYASVEEAKPTKKSNYKEKSLKNTLAMVCMIAIIGISALLGYKASEMHQRLQNNSEVSDYFGTTGVWECMKDATWHRVEDGEYKYGYHHGEISSFVRESENPDLMLYGVYRCIGTNRTDNMDRIVQGAYEEYGTFDEFLKGKGFVDKNGSVSREIFEKRMGALAIAEKAIQDSNKSY